MGNSTIQLGKMFDLVAARGIFDPRTGPSGFGDALSLNCANDTIADLICERFNWKWNSQIATPFYTNSWQQDYPQLAQPGGPIGWGEDLTAVDINNTQIPKPIAMPTPKWRRNLPRVNAYGVTGGGYLGCFTNLCWMYNKDLTIAQWPGANVTFYPLVGNGPTQQNPIMNMLDANGNILIVTTFGTTFSGTILAITGIEIVVVDGVITLTLTYSGDDVPFSAGLEVTLSGLTTDPGLNNMVLPIESTGTNTIRFTLESGSPLAETAETGSMAIAAGAPLLPVDATEGQTVPDGSVMWTCVSPNSQGFRIDNVPSATGVVWQVIPTYQLDPPTFTTMQQMINPLPDSYSRYFRRGLEFACLECSPNPGDMKREGQTRAEWLESLAKAMRQGDREINAYGLMPARGVIEGRGNGSGLITADNPWGTN
jgi:hypothetical protein